MRTYITPYSYTELEYCAGSRVFCVRCFLIFFIWGQYSKLGDHKGIYIYERERKSKESLNFIAALKVLYTHTHNLFLFFFLLSTEIILSGEQCIYAIKAKRTMNKKGFNDYK